MPKTLLETSLGTQACFSTSRLYGLSFPRETCHHGHEGPTPMDTHTREPSLYLGWPRHGHQARPRPGQVTSPQLSHFHHLPWAFLEPPFQTSYPLTCSLLAGLAKLAHRAMGRRPHLELWGVTAAGQVLCQQGSQRPHNGVEGRQRPVELRAALHQSQTHSQAGQSGGGEGATPSFRPRGRKGTSLFHSVTATVCPLSKNHNPQHTALTNPPRARVHAQRGVGQDSCPVSLSREDHLGK